jgi:hypothetical protein
LLAPLFPGTARCFESWWAFAEGKATGFVFLALAVAVIAGNEARTSGGTPVWASWIAVVAGLAAVAGWVLGMWFDVPPGNLLWVVSPLVMSLWILWFGIAIAWTRQS